MTRPIDRIAAILGSLPLATAGARSAAAEAHAGGAAVPADRPEEGSVKSAVQEVCSRLDGVDDERAVDHDREPCAICGGESTRGVPLSEFIGPTMTDQTSFRSPGSAHACVCCAFVRARYSPVPGKPPAPGKKEGPRWSNFSHLYDDRGHVVASKGEKPTILAFLREPKRGPWFAAIADSGQKHVLPYATVNPAGTTRGRVRFEERNLTLPSAAGWAIVDDLSALLTAGATKDEIERGDYTPRAWGMCRAQIEAFESRHGRLRGGDWFALALWLSQRNEEQVAARMTAEKDAKKTKKEAASGGKRRAKRETEDGPGGDVARDPGGVPEERSEPVEALGPAAEPEPERSAESIDSGRVGDDVVPRAATPIVEQLGLFGAVGAEPRGARDGAARVPRRRGA